MQRMKKKKRSVFLACCLLLSSLCLTGCEAQKKKGDVPLLEGGLYPLEETVVGDLDGDGLEEEIRVEYVRSGMAMAGEAHLYINGTDFFEKAIDEQHGENPCKDSFFVARLAPEEEWVSIGIRYDGPSSDPKTEFYRYQNGKLNFLGAVPDYTWEWDGEAFGLYVDEDGTVHGELRLNCIQTWFAPAEWKLNEKGTLELEEQEIYYPIQHGLEEGDDGWYPELEIHLRCELPVYEEPGDREAEQTMMQPQTVKLTATDDEHWTLVEGEDGTSGWFYFEDWGILPDLGKNCMEVFDNLNMAD